MRERTETADPVSDETLDGVAGGGTPAGRTAPGDVAGLRGSAPAAGANGPPGDGRVQSVANTGTGNGI